ncbi:hypothetical protein CcI49_23195 [Frankia sp. CcI49]|nr:hypothetical protein CcI49_23195 [Frankia sp. CcI49]
MVTEASADLAPVTDEEALAGTRADTYDGPGGSMYAYISVLLDFREGRGCPYGLIRVEPDADENEIDPVDDSELWNLARTRAAARGEGLGAVDAWRRILATDLRDHHSWHEPELCPIGDPDQAKEIS